MSHKNNKFRFKYITVIILIFLLLFYFVQFSKTFIQIRSLPQLDDPIAFAQEFDGAGYRPTELTFRCKFFVINCEGNEYLKSTYFPGVALKERTVAHSTYQYSPEKKVGYLTGESRSIHVDTFWNVFWIEIPSCMVHDSCFYGPFRAKI